LALAAGMTFYSLLAIFPALAAFVAIYGLFSDPASITGHLDQVSGFMPSGAIDVARDQLTRVASKGNQALGITFAIGLGVSLWSANAAMKSLFDTLNIVYAEHEKRGFGRGDRLHDMALAFRHRYLGGSGARRRNGAPDGARYHDGTRKAPGRTRRAYGRFFRRSEKLVRNSRRIQKRVR
jgi:hypothetical protein